MNKRFFDGYNGTSRSSIAELQVFFHPAYKNLSCLDYIMDSECAGRRRCEVKNEVNSLAMSVSSKLCSASESSPVRAGMSSRSSRNSARSAKISSHGIWNFSEFEDQDTDNSQQRPVSAAEEVVEEIDKYLSNETAPSTKVSTQKLLGWWRSKSHFYLRLT